MTYLAFLGLFLVVPISLLLIRNGVPSRREALVFGVLALVALLYTTPWDDAIIRLGVWSYPTSRVLGWSIGRVPVEECTFYVLQVALVALVYRVVATARNMR